MCGNVLFDSLSPACSGEERTHGSAPSDGHLTGLCSSPVTVFLRVDVRYQLLLALCSRADLPFVILLVPGTVRGCFCVAALLVRSHFSFSPSPFLDARCVPLFPHQKKQRRVCAQRGGESLCGGAARIQRCTHQPSAENRRRALFFVVVATRVLTWEKHGTTFCSCVYA